MDKGCCCWGLLALSIGTILVIITLCFLFLNSGSDISEKVSGNANRIVNNEEKEISVFHFTNLSNKMDDQVEAQGWHNSVKYGLIFMIIVILLSVGLYKCKNYKKSKKRQLRMADQLEMVEVHNESLAAQGMLKQPQSSKRKEENQKKKDEEEKQRKEQEKKELKEEKKQKKKPEKKKKKKIKRWVEVMEEVTDSENSDEEH